MASTLNFERNPSPWMLSVWWYVAASAEANSCARENNPTEENMLASNDNKRVPKGGFIMAQRIGLSINTAGPS